MTEYTLINSVTGLNKTIHENDLTRKITSNDILIRENENIGIITYRDLVLLARWCFNEMMSHASIDSVPSEATQILEYVDQWLIDEKSINLDVLEELVLPSTFSQARYNRHLQYVAFDIACDIAWIIVKIKFDWHHQSLEHVVIRAANFGVSYQQQAQWLVEHLRSGN